MKQKSIKIAVIGLGYVGLPLAVEFSKKYAVVGFDLKSQRIEDLKEQLAKQEIELTKKNDEADKLIEVVGVETEKVSKEKATADKEKLKEEVA